MGLLAGSTVMLLTVIWGTCVVVGKCDIEDSVAIDGKDTRGLSLTGLPLYHATYCWISNMKVIDMTAIFFIQLPNALLLVGDENSDISLICT